MRSTNYIDRLAARIDRLPVGPIAAVLLGGALAFFLWAMPVQIIERAVAALGLPKLLPAAAPPLGVTARLIVAGALSALVAALTWLAFVAIDRAGHSSRAILAEPDIHDAIFDAPLPADLYAPPAGAGPIFAGSELGEPPLETAAQEPDELLLDTPLEIGEVAFEAAVSAPLPPPPARGTESVTDLMARLEAGLTRRAAADAPQHSPVASVTPLRRDPQARLDDDMLRDALDVLQKMAGQR